MKIVHITIAASIMNVLQSLSAKIVVNQMKIAIITIAASIINANQSMSAKIIVNRMKIATMMNAAWTTSVNQSMNVKIVAMTTLIVPQLTVVNLMVDVDLRMNVNAQKIACQRKIALKMNVAQVTVIVDQILNFVMTYILAFQITIVPQMANVVPNLVIVVLAQNIAMIPQQ